MEQSLFYLSKMRIIIIIIGFLFNCLISIAGGSLTNIVSYPTQGKKGWGLAGNSVTSPSLNFVGTTDSADFVVKVNNVEKARFKTGNTTLIGDVNQILNLLDLTSVGGSIVRTVSGDGNSQNGITGTIAGRSMALYTTGNTFNGYTGTANTTLLAANQQALHFQQFGGAVGDQEMRFNIGNGGRRMTLTTTGLGIGVSVPTGKLDIADIGSKTANYTSATISNTTTSSAAGASKTGLLIVSSGTWNGSNASNVGLRVSVSGGAVNFPAIFTGGNVGIGVTTPTNGLDMLQSLGLPINTISTNTTLDNTYHTVINTGGAVTITLPLASSAPRRVYCIANHGSGNITFSATITTSGTTNTNTLSIFDGANLMTIQSDGTVWRKIK